MAGATSTAVLGEAGFDEFADEGGGERFFGGEADGAFAGVVVFEFVLVSIDDRAAHEVEGAVVRGSAEADERAVLPERGQPIADAFFGLRGSSVDGLAKLFEGGTFVLGDGSEVLVDGLRSCRFCFRGGGSRGFGGFHAELVRPIYPGLSILSIIWVSIGQINPVEPSPVTRHRPNFLMRLVIVIPMP